MRHISADSVRSGTQRSQRILDLFGCVMGCRPNEIAQPPILLAERFSWVGLRILQAYGTTVTPPLHEAEERDEGPAELFMVWRG